MLFPRIRRAARKGVLPRMKRGDGLAPVGALICIENLSHYIERALALRRVSDRLEWPALARMRECARRYSPGERFWRWCKV